MKLVRDRIPDIIRAEGREPNVIWVSGDTAAVSMNLLRDKLVEEATEVYQALTVEDLVSEVADVLEVCYTMLEHFGKTPQDAEQARQEKLAHSGGFKQLVLLRREFETFQEALGTLVQLEAEAPGGGHFITWCDLLERSTTEVRLCLPDGST